MKITHTSKDIDVKKYLEALLSEFESSYVLSKIKQNKIVSDYFKKMEVMLHFNLLNLMT